MKSDIYVQYLKCKAKKEKAFMIKLVTLKFCV